MILLIVIYLLSIPLIIIQYYKNWKFKYSMWIGINVIYILILLLSNSGELYIWICFSLLFLINLIDIFCSDSFDALTMEK